MPDSAPPSPGSNRLGNFLRDRRQRLDPAAFGFKDGRRRTPGLRREEVAQRANISPTWYTWLEQGRGGAPSADVLDRIANGLMLTEAEREHLFILGLGRPPDPKYRRTDAVSPRLQRVLDAMPASPAIIKTTMWDVIAWNKAATVLFTNYAKLEPRQRNILRLMFGNSRARASQADWQIIARHVVAAFRADAAKAGAGAAAEIARLVAEISGISPEFEALWHESDVAEHGEGLKRLRHPHLGLIELEFSSFSVAGRPDLGMMVYNPATDESAARIERFLAEIG